MDPGLDQAFRYLEALLLGREGRPGLSLAQLERLMGYPSKGEGPLSLTLPPRPELKGVNAVRFHYYPKDPQVQLIVEVEDREGERHIRHFRWDGRTWVTPEGLKGELRATAETPGVLELEGTYYLGFNREEAQVLSRAIRQGEAPGAKYLLCPQCGAHTYYAPGVRAEGVACPRCGNPTLLFKTLSLPERKDPLEELLEEQRALRRAIEALAAYLKRKLGP